ncbi:MAG: ABC transporter substrate-binding protein, partial [Beijerinckiaceae bacterium]
MISKRTVMAGALALAASAGPALAQDKVSFGTNWVAQAEHGGYYQAVADGTYKKYGLDVTIVPGGPQANNRMLLTVGRLDFYMGANLLQAFSAVEQNIPTVVVAAIFQKEPQVLVAHPDQGIETFADLKKLPSLYISKEGVATYYQWMKADHGFKDEQVKPYTFNPQPFLADKRSAMQGYLSSEPYLIEKTAGFKPKVFLLADNGFETYSTTIDTRLELIQQKPDVVKRFIEATAIGWYNYLYHDNKAANDLIKKDNPEMTDDKIAYAIA